jgi:hypothetical protein
VLERGVAVVRTEDDSAQQALRQQLRHRLTVGGLGVRVREGRFEDDVHIRLRRRPEGHPPHSREPDVVAHLEVEHVPVEGERLVVVVDGDEALGEPDVHGRDATRPRPGSASPCWRVVRVPAGTLMPKATATAARLGLLVAG